MPLAAAILGACGCLLIVALPRGPGAIAALALWTGATLARGERGLARWIPRFPPFGSLLAACTILVRWYALISLENAPDRLWTGVIAAMTLGSAASIALSWISRPVDDAAFHRLSPLTTPVALTGIAEGVVATLLCGPRIGSVLVLSAYVLLRVVAAFTNMRNGGIRGSDLEGLRVITETTALTIAAGLRDL